AAGRGASCAAGSPHLGTSALISLERLLELLHDAPARRFGLGTPRAEGQRADLTAFDLEKEYTVDPSEFATMGRATPFAGCRLSGRCRLTMVGGEIVWQEEEA